ncbi:septin [Grosmannia clavigera kw1407]|uniref:Septin n=1 Tax=Grosmannia clavigera (strain kw1407 / UAMH 11150) TaxID=655863 RepID=F0XKI0_GROCL|nr:septin [Grosmannia clavigera kw1407]EFX01625.1 septin [Grosmannia clavigera kw1407]
MLLRRSKSSELKGKKAQALREQELQRQREVANIPNSPPRLPVLYNGATAPNLQNTFGEPAAHERAPDMPQQDRFHGNYTPRPSMEPTPSVANVPIPPIPQGAWVDPYARTESMTHRGRYSYASSAISTINSPRRVRRRKDPTPFNILIIGTRSAGKSSFLEFLKTSLALPGKKRNRHMDADEFTPVVPPAGNFIPPYLETEIDGERIGLTLWDSEGLEKNVVDLQLREMSAFLESKFEDTFNEEMKVVRSPGVQDTHIHAAFLILDPSRLDRNIAASKAEHAASGNGAGFNGGPVKYVPQSRVVGALDEDLDLQVLRTLQGKTTVIPVISKADTITTKHMNVLKKSVWDSLRRANLAPLEPLGLDDCDDGDSGSAADSSRIEEETDEETAVEAAEGSFAARVGERESDGAAYSDDEKSEVPVQGTRGLQTPSRHGKRTSISSGRRNQSQDDDELPQVPMSIISPDIYEPGIVGRQFPWGFADPNNEEHCDFLRLKDAVFSEWRGELREASREQWYEGWRTSRLKQRDVKAMKASLRR